MTYDYPHFGPYGFDQPIWLAVWIGFWTVSACLVLSTIVVFARALLGIPCSRWMTYGWLVGLVAEFVVWLLAMAIPDIEPPEQGGLSAIALIAGGCGIISWILSMLTINTNSEQTTLHAMTVLNWTVIALLIAFVVPFVFTPMGRGRGAAKRSQCKNNLKQVGLAFKNYSEVYGRFPDATFRSDDRPAHSWRVALLPYIDQAPLYQRYRFDKTWDSAENEPFAHHGLVVLSCPSIPERLRRNELGQYYSDYVVVTGPGTSFPHAKGLKPKDIKDGTSTTALVVEACGQQTVWTKPQDIEISPQNIGINLPGKRPYASPGTWSSFHKDGAHTLMADGAVRFISKNTDPQVLKALLTATGGDTVGELP